MNESESVTSSLPGPQVVQLVCDLVQLVVELARLTGHKAGTTLTRVLKQEEFSLAHFRGINWYSAIYSLEREIWVKIYK